MKAKTIYQIARELENNSGPHRWNAEGADVAAIILGFLRPGDDDPSGIWTHEGFGDFHDSQMRGVCSALLENWFRYSQPSDLSATLANVGNVCKHLQKQISDSIQIETANMELLKAGAKVVHYLRRVRRICRVVNFQAPDEFDPDEQ